MQVCHIVIYVHEGSRFDTQILKRLRTLQAARQALAPFIKSHVTPLLSSKHSSSAYVNVSVRSNSSDTPPASRGGSNSVRQASAVSYMSGLSSSPSLYPGHYVPLLLFALLDDFPEGLNLLSHVHDPTDGSAIAPSSTTSFHRPTLPAKGPASVVMLTRPSSKVEANNRRKLQLSLEAQIRSLVRKSRILTGTEGSYSAARSGAHAMFSPLFFLDSSRAIVLLDKRLNCRGESLDFTTGLVIKDMLNPNLSLETMIQESSNQNLSKEDFQLVKDVIHRQIDALRGKGGLATNSGPTTAVGMVAVAAAAAAASAASGKPPQSPPRLPTFRDWISCTFRFSDYLLCGHWLEKEKGNDKYITANEKEAINAVDTCLSLLDSGTDLNMKFSTAWCVRALPAAKEVYLKDLPACYPTIVHDSQLERALRAFNLMVKGPAVQYFGKKLAEECNSIWKSGRQLCDAVSLTGKQCVHQRHVVSMSDSPSDVEVKHHYSGYVFLHACPCGRSRQLRSDPFDFKSANTKFSCSADCENLLPAMQIPKTGNNIEFYIMSWNLIRVGGAKYYEPSKGLLQSGFCCTEKFLLKWTIFLKDQILPNGMTKTVISQKGSTNLQSCSSPVLVGESETKKASSGTIDHLTKSSEFLISDDPKIKFGKGLPHFPLKKPFLEVVAGSISSESAFPPLPPKKQSIPNAGKGNKQKLSTDKIEDKNLVTNAMKVHLKEDRLSKDGSDFGREDGDPFLQIGSNVVPVNVNGGGKLKANTLLKEVVVYIGFEHECPHGHRFLLSPEHLNELDLDALSEDSGASVTPASNKHPDAKSLEHSYVSDKNGTNELSKLYKRTTEESKSANDLIGCLNEIRHDDGGFAFSLLNKNLPIYMNCPHCKNSRTKIDNEKSKFASTISQLQRIFVV